VSECVFVIRERERERESEVKKHVSSFIVFVDFFSRENPQGAGPSARAILNHQHLPGKTTRYEQ
jgi:hypothetical protein